MRLSQKFTTPPGRDRKNWTEPPFWQLDHLRRTWETSSNGRERIENDFPGYVQHAYKTNGVIFSCILVRQLVFAEARFAWREISDGGRPGDLFGSPELGLLAKPWPTGTTGELLARMESDVSLAGNFYATTVDKAGRVGRAATGPGRRIVRMSPDRVTIVIGSESGDPDALDAQVIGFDYQPRDGEPVALLADEVSHYSPIPDPQARWRGMSWLSPVLEEIAADKAATLHKRRFFENGAVPSLVVTFDKDVQPERFERFRAAMDARHRGALNAYKTLFLGGGADAKTIGTDFQQLDLKGVQGHGETRIAAAAGVPPVIVGLSEGLAAATYSNYAQARRRFADGTIRPLWRMAAASLQTLILPPSELASLWYDDRDIPFLREDRRDVAEIQARQASTIRQLVDAGYEASTVVASVAAEDFSLLRHTGLFSVQLQRPNTTQPQGAPFEQEDL
ncbi:HK97 family phage portal protein [Kibdelosporangium banguiense]|uniref:HK97 family phage portal protein n=1 Tax=Kibdelosporangium banguiense TaxID=1365924 RepID=A0ABS4TLR2_9PSEU|nr:phage portal protein [Kibdelosporangium banguiense]MBP2325335.1 HK97 family phage portal protein [Kibdelosporangium banguiense]